ncbi:MAG: hypothetical protein WC712_13555 [Candidatus Brocadiia bacterium]
MSEAAANSVLTGIGVVIDDYVLAKEPEKDDIVDILAQIEKAGIPCKVYDRLPTPDTYKHFANVAFILLDWQLWKKPAEELGLQDVAVGGEFEKQGVQANIEFLKGLRDSCFAPVFIFSYLDPDGIKKELRDANLLDADEKHAFILVRKKSDLKSTGAKPLLKAVIDWIEGNPSIYVLSHWKDAVTRSQNQLFWDLYDKHPAWPSVLWKAYDGEGDDPEHGLADILLRNMRARLFPLALEPDLVAPTAGPQPDLATTQAVLEASMIVPHARLPENQYGCGDILQDGKGKLFVNILCDCDCLARDGKDPNKIILYLLRARPMEDAIFLKEYWHPTSGLVQINATYHVLFPVSGKALRVRFGEFCQVSVGEFKARGLVRLGRLTPPYITQLRQRFALHLQREGLPRIPNEAVPKPDAAK